MKSVNRPASGLLLLAFSSYSFGQGVIDGSLEYGPATAAIPLLGGAGLVLLSMLLAAGALRAMRKAGNSAHALAAAMTVGAFFSVAVGGKLIHDAYAVPPNTPIFLSDIQGNVVAVPVGLQEYRNTSSYLQHILGLVPPSCPAPAMLRQNPLELTQTGCAVGLVLADAESCYTNYECTSSCPGDPPCSNNGECLDGFCRCFVGWTGLDCGTPDLPPVCPGDPPCSNNGSCIDGVCLCFVGWTGLDCSIPAE